MSVSRRVTMPEALDLTSTFVMGWTLPVATTERAMSPSSALASWEGSNLVVFPRAATAMPRATAATRTMRPVQSQNFRLFLRVAKGCSHIFLVSEASRSVVTQEAAARFHRRGKKLAARTRRYCRLLFWTPARRKGIATLGSVTGDIFCVSAEGFMSFLPRALIPFAEGSYAFLLKALCVFAED